MQPSRAPPRSKRHDDVRVWAGLLTGESRGEGWVRGTYTVPDTVVRITRELDNIRSNGLICLIGSQGVGKSSALMALDLGVVPGISWKPDTILLNGAGTRNYKLLKASGRGLSSCEERNADRRSNSRIGSRLCAPRGRGYY
jgi:hypothetical protein